jgi:type IV secretory pathway TraG/TraD family ATPase VirD4
MLVNAPVFAGEGDEYISSLSDAKINLIQSNIVLALTSGIPGMQADAAQLVRDLKALRPEQSFSECVVPLMSIVKDEEASSASRVLAALALDNLESERGHFAIARTSLFTENTHVKHVCAWLTYERKAGKHSDKGVATFEPMDEFEY